MSHAGVLPHNLPGNWGLPVAQEGIGVGVPLCLSLPVNKFTAVILRISSKPLDWDVLRPWRFLARSFDM